MKLEDEIKQKSFTDQMEKLTVNLIYTGNYVMAATNRFLKVYDISGQQYNVLRILRGQYPNPASINLLTERMLDKSSNASRLVEKLKIKKLVKRTECPEDRRQVNVEITAKGLDLLKKIDEDKANDQPRWKTLTKTEAKTLNDLLDKFRG
ncbi:MAG: winged helix DNA-binding protein [Flavobacteriales bacterium]|nr:winged helix DNA-binding protein [Flavobacteriales bacterium]MCB9449325.1 winged helix DNA-binding protein [Flavobacteriales bacterium]